MQAKHVKVQVRRDMAEVISAVVFEHEVEILRDIHGAGNIEVLGGDYPVVEIDAEEEFGRLSNCYGRNDQGQPYVERVIGINARQLAAFKPASADDKDPDDGDVLSSNAKQIAAALPDMPLDELYELRIAESEGKNRKGVIEAIEAEISKKEAQ